MRRLLQFSYKKMIITLVIIVVVVSAITINSDMHLWKGKINILEPKLIELEVSFAIPEYEATALMVNAGWLKEFSQSLEESKKTSGTMVPQELYWVIYLKYDDNQEERKLIATKDLEIFDPEEKVWLHSQELKSHISFMTSSLENNFFGEQVSWQEVDLLFPRKTKALVRDLETGLTFEAFRHGGTYHVDAEPVTIEDTNTLRQIFQGDWSWKRRAVIVTVGDRQIAGSMNGMPHGDGTIRDNEFSGHFCIHFYDSKLHKTNRMDPGHELMINKASNLLFERIGKSNPVEFVEMLLAAVGNGDALAARYGTVEFDQTIFSKFSDEIRFIAIRQIREVEQSDKTASVEVDLTVYFYEPNRDLGFDKKFLLNLSKDRAGWKADIKELALLLDKKE